MQINNHQIVDYDAVLDAKFGAEGTPERAEAEEIDKALKIKEEYYEYKKQHAD